MGEVGVCVLWSWSSVHQGNFSSDLPLETEMGSFFIPADDGGGDVVHSLDLLHNPNRDSSGEVGDECGGIFDFVVLGADDVQFELVDIFLELFSSGNVSSGKPVHGFLLDIGSPEGFFKVGFKCNEHPERLIGKTLLVANFSSRGSRPFLHIG